MFQCVFQPGWYDSFLLDGFQVLDLHRESTTSDRQFVRSLSSALIAIGRRSLATKVDRIVLASTTDADDKSPAPVA